METPRAPHLFRRKLSAGRRLPSYEPETYRAPADLVHRVLRDGRLFLDRDPSRRIRFEVRARNEYFDTKPLRRRYRGAERAGASPRRRSSRSGAP